MPAASFSEAENLIDVWNVLPVDHSLKALKCGINQIAVALEPLLYGLQADIAAATEEAPKVLIGHLVK